MQSEHPSISVWNQSTCSTRALNQCIYSTLQHTATHCNTLQHTATHCNTLQHTATHCNTLQQHTATHFKIEYAHLESPSTPSMRALIHHSKSQALDIEAVLQCELLFTIHWSSASMSSAWLWFTIQVRNWGTHAIYVCNWSTALDHSLRSVYSLGKQQVACRWGELCRWMGWRLVCLRAGAR